MPSLNWDIAQAHYCCCCSPIRPWVGEITVFEVRYFPAVASKVRYDLRMKSLQKGRSDIFAYDICQKSHVRNQPKIADLLSNLGLWWHSPGSCYSIGPLQHHRSLQQTLRTHWKHNGYILYIFIKHNIPSLNIYINVGCVLRCSASTGIPVMQAELLFGAIQLFWHYESSRY